LPTLHGVTYRDLRPWKRELLVLYRIKLPELMWQDGRGFETDYLYLGARELVIKEWYAWDDASGPTWDTDSTLRASLIHDACYQLIRLGVLSRSAKSAVDRWFHDLLLEDGMNRLRAWYWLKGVQWFGRPWED